MCTRRIQNFPGICYYQKISNFYLIFIIYETWSKLLSHSLHILTKFHNDLVKIVDFLLLAYFLAIPYSPFTHCIFIGFLFIKMGKFKLAIALCNYSLIVVIETQHTKRLDFYTHRPRNFQVLLGLSKLPKIMGLCSDWKERKNWKLRGLLGRKFWGKCRKY